MDEMDDMQRVVYYFLLPLCLVVVGVWIFFKYSYTPIEVDSFNCVIGEKPSQHLVLIIDKTDNLTEKQKEKVSIFLEDIAKDNSAIIQLGRYSRISIFILDTPYYNNPDIVSIDSLCKPPTRRDATPLESGKWNQIDFEKYFGSQIHSHIEGLIRENESDQSFILESLLSIASMAEFDTAKTPPFVVVFSDFLQNTPNFSQYRNKREYWEDNARKTIATFSPTPGGDFFRGATVHMEYFRRNGNEARRVQGFSHIEYWRELFRELGASAVKYEDEKR